MPFGDERYVEQRFKDLSDDMSNLNRRIDKVNERVERLNDRLSKVENKINIAMGGIGVLGVTAITNLITNILQTGAGQ